MTVATRPSMAGLSLGFHVKIYPLQDAPEQIPLVFGPHDRVALRSINQKLSINASSVQCRMEDLIITVRDAQLSAYQKRWSANRVNKCNRGILPVILRHFPRIALEQPVPPGTSSVYSSQQSLVGPPFVGNGHLESVRMCDDPIGEMAAITVADDTKLLRISHPTLHQIIYARHYIIEVALIKILVISPLLDFVPSIYPATPVIRDQYSKSLRCPH